jgi:hypothetical protein
MSDGDGDKIWHRANLKIQQTLDSLGRAILNERPAAHWTVTHSENEVKPLHRVFVASSSPNWTDSVVLSVMFTWADGPLTRLCSLMIEDGDLLASLPDAILGKTPSQKHIEMAVDEVVSFADQSRATILSALPEKAN